MKRLDFPVRPYLLKYLQVHLKLTDLLAPQAPPRDYVLSRSNRFGFALNQLLRKQAQSARHVDSVEDCTARLGIDLRNFNGRYYDLEQGKLSAYVVFQFNDYVDEVFREELYWWVSQHRERRGTIKDGIRTFTALYDISEDELAYETLRKDVQRNAELPVLPRPAKKVENFPMKMSQKMGEVSRKAGTSSQKTGVLSQKDLFAAVRQELKKLPLPLFEADFFYRHELRAA